MDSARAHRKLARRRHHDVVFRPLAAHDREEWRTQVSLADEVKRILAGWSSVAAGPQLLEAADGGQRLSCDMQALDTLGCSFTRFTLHSDALSGATLDVVRQMAEQLSRRLTYLL